MSGLIIWKTGKSWSNIVLREKTKMATKRSQTKILLVTYITYGLFQTCFCQFPGRSFRQPAQIRFNGQSGFSPFSRGLLNNHAATTNNIQTHIGLPLYNVSQGARGNMANRQFQNDFQRQAGAVTNSRSLVNQARLASLRRQNSQTNQTVYNLVGGNEQSRNSVPSTGQSVRNEMSQLLPHVITTASRSNRLNNVGSRRILPASAVRGLRPNARQMLVPQSGNHGRSRQVHTSQNVQFPPSPPPNPLVGQHSIARPIQAQVHGIQNRVNHISMPTGSRNGRNMFHSQLAENRIDPRYSFGGLQNEAFQYGTSITRTPASNRFVSRSNRQQFTGNPVSSLNLPFEPLSLRYQGLRNTERGSQKQSPETSNNLNNRNTGRTTNSLPFQAGLQFVGGPTPLQSGQNGRNPVQQTGLQFGETPLQQTGFQFGEHSRQQVPQFNGANVRGSQQNINMQRRRQGQFFANTGSQRNILNTRPSLHEILGISESGLRDAALNSESEVVRTTQSNPRSNNVRVPVAQGGRHRGRTQNGVLSGRNSNNHIQIKTNLIADIRRTLNIADRLDLFRRRLSDNVHSRDTVLRNILNGLLDGQTRVAGLTDDKDSDSEADD